MENKEQDEANVVVARHTRYNNTLYYIFMSVQIGLL